MDVSGGILGLVNGVQDLAEQKLNNQYQLGLMAQANKYNKEAVDYQYQKELEMFHNTGYAAKVADMKSAGLNPGLIFGIGAGGGGGVTGNISAPVINAGSAPQLQHSNGLEKQGMLLQLAKLESEIDVNKSIAEQNRANIPKLSAEVPKLQAETLGQQTTNALLALDYEIKTAGKFANIDTIISLSQKAKVSVENEIQDLISKKTQNQVDTATIQAKINQYNANVQKTIYETMEKSSQNELNKQKWRESVAEIAQKWIDKELTLEQMKTQLQIAAMNNGTKMDATELNGIMEIMKGLIQAGAFALLK